MVGTVNQCLTCITIVEMERDRKSEQVQPRTAIGLYQLHFVVYQPKLKKHTLRLHRECRHSYSGRPPWITSGRCGAGRRRHSSLLLAFSPLHSITPQFCVPNPHHPPSKNLHTNRHPVTTICSLARLHMPQNMFFFNIYMARARIVLNWVRECGPEEPPPQRK